MHIYFYRAPKNIWILILIIAYFDYWVLLLYCDCRMSFSLRLCRGEIFSFLAVYFYNYFLWSKRSFDKLWQGWWFFILVSFVLISMSVFVCYWPSRFGSSFLIGNSALFIFAFSLLFYGCLSFLILSLCNLQEHKANRSKILEMTMFQIIFKVVPRWNFFVIIVFILFSVVVYLLFMQFIICRFCNFCRLLSIAKQLS